jgi:hypothetical protein
VVYEINDTAQRERLMELAREGRQRAWWQPYDLRYSTYIDLEAEAASISNYDTDFVPGLLQATRSLSPRRDESVGGDGKG